jgi:hypothetical protein
LTNPYQGLKPLAIEFRAPEASSGQALQARWIKHRHTKLEPLTYLSNFISID